MILDIRYKLKLLISVSMVLVSSFYGQAQNLKTKETDAWKYMHMLSPEEMNVKVKIDKDFKVTDPPTAPVESLAEFEPMAGVLIRYPFGVDYNLIKSLAQLDTLFTIIANGAEEQTVKDIYSNYGVKMEHCKFILAETDSYWTRDYGPMFTAGKDSIGITDFIYNRSFRPNDNEIPKIIASKYRLPYYSMSLIHTGGNYMTDGYGIAASTRNVTDDNTTISTDSINGLMKDYLGIQSYHIVKDPNSQTNFHIDCWGKFLDVDKIMIRSVPQSHPQYDEIEAVAEYFKNQQSSWGNNYQVFRVYTPNNEPYTNSFILNKRVFVPLMSNQWDASALETYRKAMPGYEVIGFEYNITWNSITASNWYSTDALHCRVHEMADKQMVRIKHIPIRGAQGNKTDFTFKAAIKAYSGKPLQQDSVRLFYKVDNANWQSTKMLQISQDTFSVNISAVNPDQTIEYYIYAVDQVGKRASLPLVGASAPFVFVTSDIFTNTQTDIVANDIKVYPNPVRDWVTVSVSNSNLENLRFDLYNSKGQKINIPEAHEIGNKMKVNISDLPSGLYILRLHTGKFQKSIKISKE